MFNTPLALSYQLTEAVSKTHLPGDTPGCSPNFSAAGEREGVVGVLPALSIPLAMLAEGRLLRGGIRGGRHAPSEEEPWRFLLDKQNSVIGKCDKRN